jgi:hypothetical protein
MPTEDPVESRSSKAWGLKLNAAVEVIEGLFWAVPLVGAIVFSLIAALVQGCAEQ